MTKAHNAPTDFERAERIARIEVSEIVVMSEAARARRAEGHDVISLGIGEPDFDTPDHVREAAKAAIDAGDSKYPPIAGKPELRAEIASQYENRTAANVMVSSGSKYTLLNAFLASLNPGDEVIMPAPYWTSYSDIVRLCGGVPVTVETDPVRAFKPDPDKIKAAMTEKTAWLLVNSPGNPSGAVFGKDDWQAIGEIIEGHGRCWLMSDEIYQHLTYDTAFISAHDALPSLRDRMLVVNGVSKAYAMTGWRLGYGIGPEDLIKAMTVTQSQGTSGTSTISQAAALAALQGPQDLLVDRRKVFQSRRDLVLSHLGQMQGIACPKPDGAFYAFPSWQALRGGITPQGEPLNSDGDFCRYILEAANVTIIPGSAFAMPGYFRISYACSSEELDEALTRMGKAVAAIKAPQ